MHYIKNIYLFSIILILIPIVLLSSDKKETNQKLDIKNKIKIIEKKSYISEEYFKQIPKCSPSCGVAIKGWTHAKEYCYKRNKVLAPKSKIKKAISKRDACQDCNYWTSTEVISKKGKKNKVTIYLNLEKDFLYYPKDSIYIATCLSE